MAFAQSAPIPEAAACAGPDLSAIPQEDLEAMHDAAATVLECERVLAEADSNVVAEVLRGQGDFVVWDRYPRGDVADGPSHYFYHSHTPDEMADGENGHFHLFVRPATFLPGLEPWRLPGAAIPQAETERHIHLCALSVDGSGRPLKIFTTNRWVTDETFYRAVDVIALLDRFEITHAHPHRVVNRWLKAMVTLYRPQIVALLRERDGIINAWMKSNPGSEVLEDRRLQNISEAGVSLGVQIAAIEKALRL